MHMQKISEIKSLAHSIDGRINVFEGFSPKKTDGYKGQVLFWRYIVNLYGMFGDCDRSQIKSKISLMELMKRFSLISNDEFSQAKSFWVDVSELRKWFCHNNNDSLFYQANRKQKIKQYLSRAYIISSEKPESLDEIEPKDWSIIVADIQRRYETYLDILERGFVAWKSSEDKEEIIEEWIKLISKTLFMDKELIQNILVETAQLEIMDKGLNVDKVALSRQLFEQLNDLGYSANNIKTVLIGRTEAITNKEIVYESLKQIEFSL